MLGTQSISTAASTRPRPILQEYTDNASSPRSTLWRAKKGSPFGDPRESLRIDGSVQDWRAEQQRAGWIGQRAYDVERGTSAIGLLQRPVAHVQLQPKQHAMVGDLGVP